MENLHTVNKIPSFYFAIIKNIHRFAITFVSDKYNFYTFTYLQLNLRDIASWKRKFILMTKPTKNLLRYFQGDELAARVWVNKYAVKDSFGNIYEKSPEDMHWRIANEVARIEAKYPNALSSEELFGLFNHFKYIVPQGSPMTGIGNNYQVASLSNCFCYRCGR